MKNNDCANLTVFLTENLLLYHNRSFEPLRTSWSVPGGQQRAQKLFLNIDGVIEAGPKAPSVQGLQRSGHTSNSL